MLKGLYKGWVDSVCRGDPSFLLPVGITAVMVFAPTLAVLSTEQVFRTSDLFPGANVVLPWSIAFSAVFLCLGAIVTFFGVRNGAYPGSFLYRLTHFGGRKRGL